MWKDIIFIASGLVIGILVMVIQKFIKKQATKVVLNNISPEDKTQLERLYSKGLLTLKEVQKYLPELKSSEAWDGSKFVKGMSNITSAKKWGEEIHSIFNIRKLAIYGVIIGVIFGYGWYNGRMQAPAAIVLKSGAEVMIQLNKEGTEWLHITKDGKVHVQDSSDDKTATIHYTIKVGDIVELKKSLKPYGFQLVPIGVIGGGLGSSGASFEAGVGVSWAKYYKTQLDAFITNRGLYPLAVSYQITDNSGLGLGYGFGFKGDQRVILYYRWKF